MLISSTSKLGSPSDGPDASWKNAAIAIRSSRDCASFVVESPPRSSYGGRWSINTMIVARSRRDRGPIVVLFEVKLKLTHHQIGAELKPRPMTKESLPRPLQITPTTASIGHDLRAKFPFKNRCISLFVLQLLIDS